MSTANTPQVYAPQPPSDDGSAAWLVLLLIIIVGIAIGVIWYMKYRVPEPIIFKADIYNETNTILDVVMPTGIIKTFQIGEKQLDVIVTSGTYIIYTIKDDSGQPVTYKVGVEGSSPTTKQEWFLTKGGIYRLKQQLPITNAVNTPESKCALYGIDTSFTPMIIWAPTITEFLAPIPPRTTTPISYYTGGNQVMIVKFKYTKPDTNKTIGYWVLDSSKVNVGGNTPINLMLDENCEPLYPSPTQSTLGVPRITFALGGGVGSPANLPGTNIPYVNPLTGLQDFCIATDVVQGSTTTAKAGNILLRSKDTTPDKWVVPINQLVNNKVYVGAYGSPDTSMCEFSRMPNGDLVDGYNVCKTDTSHTLYIYGGKQDPSVAGCGNSQGPTDCANVNPDASGSVVYKPCIAHLSETPGNYTDKCNTEANNTCTKDIDCEGCWGEPRYCDTLGSKCTPKLHQTAACTKSSMCNNDLPCTANGYCGSSPAGGKCAVDSDCPTDHWCYHGVCVPLGGDSMPCKPMTTTTTKTCKADYCCKETRYGKVERSDPIKKCDNHYTNGWACVPTLTLEKLVCVISEPSQPNFTPCRAIANGPQTTPIVTCTSGYTYVDDPNNPLQGGCVKCPVGYTVNPKYKQADGTYKCPNMKYTSGTLATCDADMCVPAPGETGFTCVYNRERVAC
jgi:hypothetical protein